MLTHRPCIHKKCMMTFMYESQAGEQARLDTKNVTRVLVPERLQELCQITLPNASINIDLGAPGV